MKRVPVSSSLIASVGHDPAASILEIEFNHEGRVYRYENVDKVLFDAMMQAESVGKYFSTHIKKNPSVYPCVRVS